MDNAQLKLTKTLTQIRLRETNGVLDINGVSMEPLIYEGDLLCIETRPEYFIGDIVVVVDMQCRILVHRIVRFTDDMIITKGDNTVAIEESLKTNCLGIVKGIHPKSNTDITIYPYRKRLDKLIIKLSLRMNKKFASGMQNTKVFKGWERKFIVLIEKLFYRH